MVASPQASFSRRAVLTGAAGAFATPFFPSTASAEDAGGRKVILVDAAESQAGSFVSLETAYDGVLTPGRIDRDIVFSGASQFVSGESVSVDVVIAKDYANSFAFRQSKENPRIYELLAAGQPQPANGPQQFTFTSERRVPNTPFVRVSGQVYDPTTKSRVNFAVTHDPEPATIVAIAIVAGVALLICGAIVLTDRILESANSEAEKKCGARGAKSIKAIRTYGFAWREGAPEVGCGTTYEVVCK